MRQIGDFGEISRLVTAHMKPGVFTNNFITSDQYRAEISSGTLYAHEWDGGLLFLRKRDGWHLLTFYVHDVEAAPGVELPPDTVTEIAQKPGGAASIAVGFWEQAGLNPEFERIRMARSAGSESVPGDHTAHIVREADFDGVLALLNGSFDPSTGCLPTETELRDDIMQGNVLCVKDSTVCGVLRTVTRSASVEIRQLAVREDMRGRGVAKSLVQAFVERYGDKKSTVWLIDGNAPALHVYTSAGFALDGWKSTVLTIKPREAS